MSTSYFVLSKPHNKPANETDNDNIVVLPNQITYMLPHNLLDCYATRGLFESNLIEWCKQFCDPDKVVLDIGAHTGSYALSLAPNAKHIYAFEPQKMTYYALCGGVALSNMRNVTCLNIGLGSPEQVGTMTLNIVSNDGGGSSVHTDVGDILATEDIQIHTLDSLNIQDISFIKMDVENNELFVLEGAQNTLKGSNYPNILFECNEPDKHSDLFTFLEKLTYKIITINGVQNMYLACH